MKLAILLVTIVSSSAKPLDNLDRRLGAIMGEAVADAASMPLHWIYDCAAIDSKLGKGADRKDAVFFSPPSCPFYNYSEGENTPYGQQTRVILHTLATEGKFDPTTVQDAYWSYYGPDNAPCHKRQSATSKTGCYWDASTKGFVANYQAGKRWPDVGASDTQVNGVHHMVPLVAAFAELDEAMLKQVEDLIRVTQNTDQAVAFGLAAARILNRVVQGSDLAHAVTSVTQTLKDPKRQLPKQEDAFLADGLEKVLGELDQPNYDVVMKVGQACDYPFNLWSGSHLAVQLSETAAKNATQAYMMAIRQTIEAGGDNGSRGAFVGALFGAIVGESGIPAEWKKKYLHYDTVLADAKKWLAAGSMILL